MKHSSSLISSAHTPAKHGGAKLVILGSFTYPPKSLFGHTLSPFQNGPSSSKRSTVTRTQKNAPPLGSSMTFPSQLVSWSLHSDLLCKLINVIEGADIFEREGNTQKKVTKKMNFFRKYAELQILALQHNAGLTASHPYASGPINWPFLLSGISFWTHNETKQQIYFIGNIVGWWTCVVSLSIFVGILGADLLARRRGVQPIPECE
jgi:hypothetical protein